MYNIKIYSHDNVFKKTLSPREISSNYNITITKGLGWGDFSFVYYGSGISCGDVVLVYYDKKLVYKGFIDNIKRTISDKGDYLDVKCTGYVGILSYVFPGAISFQSKTINYMLQCIFDKASEQGYYFDTSGMVATSDTYSLNIYNTETGLTAIKKILELTIIPFFVTDKVYFNRQQKTHILTFQKDITSIQTNESIRDMYNEYIYDYTGGTYIGTDNNSIALYGRHIKHEYNQYVLADAGAKPYVDTWLSQTAYQTYNAKVRINNKYNLESIMPGDLIEIRNIDTGMDGKEITKVSYNTDYIDLDIDGIRDLDTTMASIKKY